MHPILETFKKEGDIHHAYLITGDITENISKLRDAIEKIIGTDILSYPDYHLYFTPAFNVLDSRELIERQNTMSFKGGKRFFVIASYSFNNVAQNGLLKVLEEPIPDHHFFILSNTEELLLPTLRSRLFHIDGEKLSYNEIEGWCNDFIRADIPERLVMIREILDEDDGEEKDDMANKYRIQKVKGICNQIEKVFYERIKQEDYKEKVKDGKFLSELMRQKAYLSDTAPALRLILEYIAFTCPALALP